MHFSYCQPVLNVHNRGMSELANLMALRGWTDTTLGEKVGRSRSSISRLRRGKVRNIDMDLILRISEVTGITVKELSAISAEETKGE
jgi:transcriptional regulator with XRE-family HTH domain